MRLEKIIIWKTEYYQFSFTKYTKEKIETFVWDIFSNWRDIDTEREKMKLWIASHERLLSLISLS